MADEQTGDTGNQKMNDTKKKKKHWITPFRVNVFLALIVSYGTVLAIFFGMLLFGAEAETAYNLISGPFVALVGGTLAVAKDLIR